MQQQITKTQIDYPKAPLVARKNINEETLINDEIDLKKLLSTLPSPSQDGSVDDALIEAQFDLESYMSGFGQTRYFKNTSRSVGNQQEAQTTYGRNLIKASVKRVSDKIEEFLNTKTNSRPHIAKKHLKDIDPMVVALISLRTLIDHTSMTSKLTRVCINLGGKIQDQITFSNFQKDQPKLFKSALDYTKDSTSYRHTRNAMMHCMRKHTSLDEKSLPDAAKLHIGKKLIELVIDATGFFFIQKVKTAKARDLYEISATPNLLEWIELQKQQTSTMMPLLLPTVAPPIAWDASSGGGYHYPALTGNFPVAKGTSKTWLREFDEDIHLRSQVLDTINTLQATPWNINRDVLGVADALWGAGNEIAGLPRTDREPTPIRPDDIDVNEEARKKWKRAASEIHSKNNKRAGKIMNVQQTLWIADFFKETPAIYFPHQFDFRGRLYSIPAYLTPQSTDLSKGLLKFQEGLSLDTPEAARWLAVHGANCFGYDKVSFEKREEFIEEMSERILRTAENPLDDLWWSKADSPFCFLAFIFEWAQYKREGLSFVSHLPVAMDATCSGIQHFSAMIRDPVGAAAVNLVSGESKADIYQEVCDVFIKKLEGDLQNNSIFNQKRPDEMPTSIAQYARWWLTFELDRKVTKRQVMTFPYGATLFSCTDYVGEWLEEHHENDKPWEDKLTFDASRYAARLIWDSVREVVVGAARVMEWLQGLASGASKDNEMMSWVTPVGFPVWQQYFQSKKKRIDTMLGDVKIQMDIPLEGVLLDVKRMRSSVSPNFVHGMDASHMCLTVNVLAWDAFIKSFAMIHDSFGVHARNTQALYHHLRLTFVDMYENHDVLGDLYRTLGMQLEDDTYAKLDAPLELQEFDLSTVNHSPFFFC